MHGLALAVAAAFALSLAGTARAQSTPGDTLTAGRMLYDSQCNACHLKEVHWRDRKVVRDWPGLVREVERWQRNSGLAWSTDEVLAVAHYLNAKWYRFPAVAAKELAFEGRLPAR